MTEFSKRNVPIRHPRLPWIIGAAALLIYGLTLNHGVSLRGLPLTAEMAGWTWQPRSDQPLLKLAYVPLQFVPAAWLPVSLNLLSALTAALILAVLTRSVQLLPLNRLRIQRMFVRNSLGLFSRHDAWVPAVIAAVTAGMELGFWQEATSASGEMLDLLLLAAGIWCFLDYRQNDNLNWLDRAALIWGVGMAENWTMQPTLPLFLGVIFWLRRETDYRALLWGRPVVYCLGSFLCILLLSLADNLLLHLHGASGQTFEESLRGLSQSLFPSHIRFWDQHPLFTVLVLLFFLLAALPMCLHLKREGSYHLSMQARVQLLIFQYLYGFCLLAGLWLALEPNGGPEAMLVQRYSALPPLLTLVYLNALGVGYFTAHFLLVFGADWDSIRRHEPRFSPPPFLPAWLRRTLPPALQALPVLMLTALAVRNFPALAATNQTPLLQFGQLAAQALPPGGGIVLSDDAQRLWVLQTALAQRPDRDRWAVVNTAWLVWPEYRTALDHKWPLGWRQNIPDALLTQREVSALLYRLAETNRIFYLHSSFGHFIEGLDAQPHGLTFELTRPPKSADAITASTSVTMDDNIRFWDQASTAALKSLEAYSATISARPVPVRTRQLLQLAPAVSRQSQLLAVWYSVALDDWGVWLQKNSQPATARQNFQKALALYPPNQSPACHLNGVTNLADLDVSIPSEMAYSADDSTRKLPRPMNFHSMSREIDDAIQRPPH